MGIFDQIGSFFTKSVPDFFTNTIPHAASTVFNKAKEVFHSVGSVVNENIIQPVKATVSNVVNTVYNDAKDIIKGSQNIVSNAIDKVGGTANHLIDTAGNSVNSLGQSLSMPLVLLAGCAGLFLITQKK